MLIREVVGRTYGQNWHYLNHEGECVDFRWHYHPEFELTLTRGAEGTRYLGSDVDAFEDLDLVLVAPNLAHTWHARPESCGRKGQRVQVLFFTLDWLRGVAAEGLPELNAFNDWLASVRQGVVFSRALAESLVPAFDRLHTRRDLGRLAVLMQIFDALQHDEAAHYLGAHVCTHGNDRRVESALAFLQQSYRSSVSLAQVAEASSTSPSTLKRVFRERLGMSVSDVLIQLRVGHACHLLVSTEMPVLRIAEESGFNNHGHFFRLFGRERGVPPAEFRRRYHLRSGQAAA